MAVSISTEFRDLHKYEVFDSNNVKIGNIIDIVLRAEDCSMTKIILGGSMLEELKEKFKLKADDDPIVPVDLISRQDGKKLYLSVSSNELPNKLQEGAIALGESQFSKFKKTPVISKDGEKLGQIIDGILHSDNKVSFILGDSPLTEFAERIGLTPDVDLLVPNQYIAGYKGDSLQLSVEREDLITTLGTHSLGTDGAAERIHFNEIASKDAEISQYTYW